MGKTIRRKNANVDFDWFEDGSRAHGNGKKRYQSDKLKRMSGIDSGVKDRKNEIRRANKHKMKHDVYRDGDYIDDNTDYTTRCKANLGYKYS